MLREAGGNAIADAGIDKSRIQAAYIGNFNGAFFCNQNHFGAMVTEELGLQNTPSMRTEGACASGSLAFRVGYLSIASGMYDIVLVGGVEKMCHQTTEVITQGIASGMDYELEANFGLTFPANFALIASRYFYEYRNIKNEMAMCAVNAHRNGRLNPDAQMQKEITIESALNSAVISSPLNLYDCSLTTDGSAFVVLAATEIAKAQKKHRIVEIVGTGHAGNNLTLYSKPAITSFPAAKDAAAQAYRQANLTPSDIDFAEVHDCFTITQIINMEDLGFYAPGKAANAVAEGQIALEGRLPINTSGGLKAKGHPIGATGISQIFEIVTQIRGGSGARQVKRADIGLQHNIGGTAGTAVVNIFRGR
jgi:acetyl-CoA C-acetyltransferase